MLNGIWGYVKKFVWGENKKKDKKKIYAKSTMLEKENTGLKEKYRIGNYLSKRLEKIKASLSPEIENEDEILTAASYLFENGYDDYDLEFLGSGSFNTVFLIKGTNRVVKYCKSVKGYNDGVSVDEMSIRNFENMMKDIKDPKLKKWADKYLPKIKRINQKDIYEDNLGIGDLTKTTVKKRNEKLQNPDTTQTKTLDSLIRNAKNAAKALWSIHQAGYVHQDIKPDNIVKVPNPNFHKAETEANSGRFFTDKNGEYCIISEKSEEDEKVRYFKKYKSGERHEIHRHQINITDMGFLYSIDEILKSKSTQIAGTPGYMSKEDQTVPPTKPEDVMKWDVYALGITLFELLCGHHPKNMISGEGLIYEFPTMFKDNKKNLQKTFMNWIETNSLSKLFKESEWPKLFIFLKLINNMTCCRKNRFLIPEVIRWLKTIESKNLKKMKK